MSWPVARLDECTRIVSGATPSTAIPEFWDGDICWATPKDLSELDQPYIDVTLRKITPSGLASCAAEVLPAGSVLFSSRAPIGHVAINRVPMATNQGFKSFVPDSRKLNTDFLFWWLKTHRPYLESLGNGATFKEVSKSVVARIEIPLPSLDEQRRLAALLNQADELRQNRRRSIAQLRKLEHAVFYEVFGDPVRNTKKWPIVQVGSVTDCIVPGRDKPKSFSGNTPWITTSELVHLGRTGSNQAKAGLTDHEIRQVRARVIPSESVILTCVGDLGLVSIAHIPMVINQQLHAYQCSSELTPEYLMYALSYQVHYMRRMATQTTLPYMNKTICNGIPIQLPPISAQKIFADRYNALFDVRQALLQSLDRFDALFASLQNRIFNGELTREHSAIELAMAG
jgi:type I restriction enzyme S subunit